MPHIPFFIVFAILGVIQVFSFEMARAWVNDENNKVSGLNVYINLYRLIKIEKDKRRKTKFIRLLISGTVSFIAMFITPLFYW